jgi:O-antigen/teichoic acid export membrane protein
LQPPRTNTGSKIEYTNDCDAPEAFISSSMEALHLGEDAPQLLLQHSLLSSRQQSVEGEFIASQRPFPGPDDGPSARTLPSPLTLPFQHRIPQDHGSQVLNTSSPLEAPDALVPCALQPQSDQKERQNYPSLQRVQPVPTAAPEMQAQSEQPQVIISTASSAAVAGAGELISGALKYMTNVAMTNIFSQSVYGIYAIVCTAAGLVGAIIVLGLDSTLVHFLPAYRAKGEYGFAAGLLRFVVWMTLISSLLSGTLFYLSATVLAHLIYHQDTYTLPLREVALLIPLVALQGVLASGLLAVKAIKWKVYTDRLIQPGLFLILMGVFYLLGLRLEALILSAICSVLASVIMGQVLLGKASKQLIPDVVPRFAPKAWLRFALPLSFTTFIYSITSSTDVLFLAAFATAAQVGLYAAADRMSNLVLILPGALNMVFSPLIAEYYAHGQHEHLASLSKLITKWSFSLSLPVFLCFCMFHEAILGIFSREYTAAGMALIILSLGALITSALASTVYLLVMTGHTRPILANTVVTITVNIGLSFFLVPHFNVIGAAVAATLTLVIPHALSFVQVYWILRFQVFRRDMLKSVLAGGVASIVGLLLLRVIHVGYGYQAIFGALGLTIPFMLVYVLVLVLLRFSKEDRMVVDAVRAKFGNKQSA